VPRAGLSEERVVEEAELLSDEGEPVTLALLARRLGVQVPSLYKHVASLDDLHRLMSIRARLEFASVLERATVGKAGADAVSAIAYAYREWAEKHPGRYLTTLRAPDPADEADLTASSRAIQVIYDALAAFGLEGDDAIDATRLTRSTLHGFITLNAAGAFALPHVDRGFARIVGALQHSLTNWAAVRI
jgi:AcrR family transcriptional regulator